MIPEAKIARLLRQHRIRRLDAAEVRAVLKTRPLSLAPPTLKVGSHCPTATKINVKERSLT